MSAPDLRDRIAGNLGTFTPQPATDAGLRRSAVALVVVTGAGAAPGFLLTRRAAGLRNHPGQFALPGGRLDGGESPEAAARREVAEEVGLPLGAASVLGRLDDYVTRSGFAISPVVLWAGETAPAEGWALDAGEVAAVYRVPLAVLERPEAPTVLPGDEPGRPVIQMPVAEGVLIHAPTAAVLYQFREVALHGRPVRVGHFDQPAWMWR